MRHCTTFAVSTYAILRKNKSVGKHDSLGNVIGKIVTPVCCTSKLISFLYIKRTATLQSDVNATYAYTRLPQTRQSIYCITTATNNNINDHNHHHHYS